MITRISLLGYSTRTLDSPKDIFATFAWVQDIDGKAIPANALATIWGHVLQYPHRNRILPLLFPHEMDIQLYTKLARNITFLEAAQETKSMKSVPDDYISLSMLF